MTTERSATLERTSRHVNRGLANLARLIGAPVEVRSAGTKIYTDDGTTYLDCGGFGVFLLGHRHPAVIAAVRAQLDDLPLGSRLFLNERLAEAAEALIGVAPAGLDYAMLTNSGAEAVELALKLARLAGKRKIVAMRGGFHGKSMGALSVTGRPAFRDPFEPLLPDVEFVTFGDPTELGRALRTDGATTAVVVEPVQGEGGVRIPNAGYLREVQDHCHDVGATLILDEIQTGLGRLGAWWGATRDDISPDILLTGKILGGGVMAVGGVLASTDLFEPLNEDPLLHSSTFAGNPLAAAAVSATIAVIRGEGLVERSCELGQVVVDLAREAVHRHCPHLVNDVRGRGLLVGLDFVSPATATEFMLGLLDRRVIPSYSLNSHNVLRLTPPAILDHHDIAWLAAALDGAAADIARSDLVPAARTT
ncbi:MAG: aminotransferase class III-fold pyridoxal phosphate-dependent enzyme [Ilumatobacteraceae bacterium]